MDRKREKSLYMTELMTPDMANFSGNVHGGCLLKLLDRVAYACAARYCGHYVVTASLDNVYFASPMQVGELANFMANVNYTGRTSMEVGVKVMAEDLHTRELRHTASCYFTMVAMGDNGRATPVPPLDPETDIEKRLFRAGEMRRELREEMRRRNEALHVGLPIDYLNN